MSARHHRRGRNTDWSDGRPAGFGMKLETEDEGMGLFTFACLAIAIASILYFGGQILLRGWQ